MDSLKNVRPNIVFLFLYYYLIKPFRVNDFKCTLNGFIFKYIESQLCDTYGCEYKSATK